MHHLSLLTALQGGGSVFEIKEKDLISVYLTINLLNWHRLLPIFPWCMPVDGTADEIDLPFLGTKCIFRIRFLFSSQWRTNTAWIWYGKGGSLNSSHTTTRLSCCTWRVFGVHKENFKYMLIINLSAYFCYHICEFYCQSISNMTISNNDSCNYLKTHLVIKTNVL